MVKQIVTNKKMVFNKIFMPMRSGGMGEIMGLYKDWLEKIDSTKNEQEKQKFWMEYLEKEKAVYAKILKEKETSIKGKLSDVAALYDMAPVMFSGFLDGINTSLEEELDMDKLEDDTELDCTVVYSKLYVNMIDAKADWLYNLEEWDDIYSKEERDEMRKEYNKSKMAVSDKVGRNDPCPCGSGKKFKKCCGKE